MSDEKALILVIEDDAGLVELYKIAFGMIRPAPSVDACLDGRSGLERVQRQPEPQVILLDLHLPHVEGVEIFEKARAMTKSAIVVVTADAETARRLPGKPDYVFYKPFGHVREIMECVRSLL